MRVIWLVKTLSLNCIALCQLSRIIFTIFICQRICLCGCLSPQIASHSFMEDYVGHRLCFTYRYSWTIRIGGYFHSKWFCDHCPVILPTLPSLSIVFLEMYPIVVAAVLWDYTWKYKRIKFFDDNQATVYILTKGRSKEPVIMILKHTLTMYAVNNHFAFCGEHLPNRCKI